MLKSHGDIRWVGVHVARVVGAYQELEVTGPPGIGPDVNSESGLDETGVGEARESACAGTNHGEVEGSGNADPQEPRHREGHQEDWGIRTHLLQVMKKSR